MPATTMARGTVRRGFLTSPATKVAWAKPSYANSDAATARPRPAATLKLWGSATWPAPGCAGSAATAAPKLPASGDGRRSTMTATRAATFAIVARLLTKAARLTPRWLSAVSPTTRRTANKAWPHDGNSKPTQVTPTGSHFPRQRCAAAAAYPGALWSRKPGRCTFQAFAVNRSTASENATATSAVVPDWTTVKPVQENRKPGRRPRPSRRNTYWPPDFGYAAPSSANMRPPDRAMTAPSPQARNTSGTEPVYCSMDPGRKKMPDPIMEPTIRNVSDQNPSSARKPFSPSAMTPHHRAPTFQGFGWRVELARRPVQMDSA